MFNLLGFFFASTLAPLEYVPFFDTYSDLCDRAYEQTAKFNRSGYDGFVHGEIQYALYDELDRVYKTILQNLNLDPQSLKKELKESGISLSESRLADLFSFRQKERKRLEKEHHAWMACKEAYTSLIYSMYAEGSARLVYPIYHNNSWIHQRIWYLRKHYQSVFSSSIQCKHIWGEWKHPEKETLLTFQRFCSNWSENETNYTLSTPSDSLQGSYQLNTGTLSLCENKKPPQKMWIDIVEENDSLYLERYDNAILEEPDPWLAELAERALLQEADRVHQSYIKAAKEHLEELKNQDTDEESPLKPTAYQETLLKDFEKATKAWQEWMAASYDNREQMLTNGSIVSLSHSSERNAAIYDWILMIQNDLFDFSPNMDVKISNDIFFGDWKYEKRDEIWNFAKKENAYCYRITKGGKLLESGTYHLNRGQLHLQPNQGSRQIQKCARKLNDSESQLWFKYLFGPLTLKDRYKKIAPP